MPVPEGKTHYTYADSIAEDEEFFSEIFEGEFVRMKSHSPTHQTICSKIGIKIDNFLKGTTLETFFVPLDVRLFEKAGDDPATIDTVVEPDIFVAERGQFDEYGCIGAPLFIAEILSPETVKFDCFIKLELYQRAGVREYWIADPETQTIKVFLLDDEGIYRTAKAYKRTDTIKVNILNGCFIELSKVFPEEDIPVPPHAPQSQYR